MKYPFQPEILDAMPERLAQLYRELELKLLREICERLMLRDELNEVTVQDIRALRSHGISLEEIEKAIREAAGISRKRLHELFEDVVERNQAYYGELATLADITMPDEIVDASTIAAIERQTWSSFQNITTSMGFLAVEGGRLKKLPPVDAYRHALDNAEMEILSGAISYSEAIDKATKELADSGLRYVDYESGHRDHVDVAVRRAVMTGINQVCDKFTQQSAEFLGTRYFEVSAHSGARDKGDGWQNHKSWQGGVYYESEAGEADPLGKYDDLHDTTGFGEVDGLEGANCRHHRYPFVEGVSEPTYTKEQLKHIDDGLGCTFEGRTYSAYEATQKQREIERTIRKWERREAAAVTEDSRTTARIRQRVLRQKYSEFSQAAGLVEQRERLRAYVPGKAAKSMPGSPKAAAKPVEKSVVRDTMEKTGGGGSMGKAALLDVTEEYLINAKPGNGKITFDEGYKPGKHSDEIFVAEWIHKTFGGDIHLQLESNVSGEKKADYLWNGKQWELKSPLSIKKTDDMVRYAAKQISDNPGGIIIDFKDENLDADFVRSKIFSRAQRSGLNTFDSIILSNTKLWHIFRYKK